MDNELDLSVDIQEGNRVSSTLKGSEADRTVIRKILLATYEQFKNQPFISTLPVSFAEAVEQSSHYTACEMSDKNFNTLIKVFEKYGKRNDLLYYDDNFTLQTTSDKRIGILALYSVNAATGNLNYYAPFNVCYDNESSNRPMHSAFLIDDWVFDPVLGINGAHITQYLANIFVQNKGICLNIWSTVAAPVISFLTERAKTHVGLSSYTYDCLCRDVSDDFVTKCHADLFFVNVAMHPDITPEPIVETSQLSVKPTPKPEKPKRTRKEITETGAVKKETKTKSKKSTAKDKKTGTKKSSSKAKLAADGTSTSDKPARNDKHTIDGMPREEDIPRKVQREMIEDVRKQLQAAIALCED